MVPGSFCVQLYLVNIMAKVSEKTALEMPLKCPYEN